jgi:hypothetical protein
MSLFGTRPPESAQAGVKFSATPLMQ